MPSKYPQFDRSRLIVKPLAERVNDLSLSHWLELEDETPPFDSPHLHTVAVRLQRARQVGLRADPSHAQRGDPARAPAPDPTRDPVPDRTSAPAPDPTRDRAPDPTRDPAPGPTPAPAPNPAGNPAPDPTRGPTRDPARILMMGAHVLRAGVNRHIIDLMSRGFITHVAMNGAGAIHDYELARIGATTESVARYIRSGEFGLWRETGELNDLIREAAVNQCGLGEWVGRHIAESGYRYRELSVLAAAWRLNVPATVHAGVGYDILHEHPNCDGGALGEASYRDFLIFAATVEHLEGGVLLSFGSAIMAPEVYLKALAMSRNVAHQEGREIRNFTTAVFDLVPIKGEIHKELPKTDPGYYFRPQKTILVRTVAEGGESFYFCGDHRATLPALWRLLAENDRLSHKSA